MDSLTDGTKCDILYGIKVTKGEKDGTVCADVPTEGEGVVDF